MIIGFIGDIHGRVLLALAAVLAWQQRNGREFNLIIQVGDLGAFPNEDKMDAATKDYRRLDPTEGDFARLVNAAGPFRASIERIRSHLKSPVYFIRGNHEDHSWLSQLPLDTKAQTASVDPFGLFQFVPDGTFIDFQGIRVGFLGGIETNDPDAKSINKKALALLMQLPRGTIDILVTHDGPYGLSTGYHGQVQGSAMISALSESLQPKFHIGGHYHVSLSRMHGKTSFLCLSNIVPSARWRPNEKGIQPGWLAILDTATSTLKPIKESWMSEYDTPFDFEQWVGSNLRR